MPRELTVERASRPPAAGVAAARPPHAPRFVVRVLAASFLTVVAVLAAVSSVLVFQTSAVVERGIIDDLEAGQRQLAASQRDRQRDAVLRASLISTNHTLRSVLQAYAAERAFGRDATARARLDTLQREIDPVARLLRSDVVAIVGRDGRVIASAGERAAFWPAGLAMLESEDLDAGDRGFIVRSGEASFRATVAPIAAADGAQLGHLVEARVLDAQYAVELAGAARADIAVMMDGALLVTTAPPLAQAGLATQLARVTTRTGAFEAGRERYAFLLLQRAGPASFYAVSSITAARQRVTALAVPRLAAIAGGALVLCALASWWLARRVAAPIDQVSRDIRAMIDAPAAPIGVPQQSIHELEALGEAFNRLMQRVQDARAETNAAYVGAIRALAAALDARDPYTAGHSERVSQMSVAIGRVMSLTPDELDVLRLGALLHDIGKIGISDAILTKPSSLTAEEYEAIKRHTLLGAQILRPIAFLAPHVPIVELHHERPDGRGYPYGLRGDEIPLLARIVHVADAYDAMTTARAYRRARPLGEVLTELWRNAGSDFDLAALQALVSLLPKIDATASPAAAATPAPTANTLTRAEPIVPSIVPFERRVS